MAGFQLTLYGRIWVTPKVSADDLPAPPHQSNPAYPAAMPRTSGSRFDG